MFLVKKNFYLSLILFVTLFLVSGCTLSFNTGQNTEGVVDGGVYKSINDGTTWLQKTLISTTAGKPKTFAMLDIISLAMDPSDEKAIYAGSINNGLYYTYDSGASWFQVTSLGQITVNAIAVDPKNKCSIYVASANKLIVSRDCSRTWSPIYFDNDLAETVTSIAVDQYNNNNIYIGISRGDIIKSSDQGVSWKTVNRLKDDVAKILISPNDSRIIFVATKQKGLTRSLDEGNHWEDLTANFYQLDSSSNFHEMVMSASQPGLILLANKYGILKSNDNGHLWSKLNLITPEKDATINSLVLGATDTQKIFYVTNTTFYRSVDGGQNWTTRKLPTSRAGWVLLTEPKDKGALYMAAKTIKSQQ